MKFFIIALMFVLIFASFDAISYAQDAMSQSSGVASYRRAIGDKAARGTKNILFGWTEIPKRVVDITKETNNPLWGVFAGTFQGTVKAIARTGSGLCDVVTAPVDADKDTLMQPDIDTR